MFITYAEFEKLEKRNMCTFSLWLGCCNFSWVALYVGGDSLYVGGDSAESQDAIPLIKFRLSLSHNEMQNGWKWTNGRNRWAKLCICYTVIWLMWLLHLVGCICLNLEVYLSKFGNVFSGDQNCAFVIQSLVRDLIVATAPSGWLYLSLSWSVFVLIFKCIF